MHAAPVSHLLCSKAENAETSDEMTRETGEKGAATGVTITLKQVAEAAGVSLATASYSLSNGGSVGLQTRERVKAVAQRLGYRPNLFAKAMRTGRSGTIGLVLPDLTNPFFPQLAQSVMVAARDAGHDVLLIDTLGSKQAECQSIESLVRRGVEGLVWFPIDDTMPAELSLNAVPTVVVDRSLEGLDCVVADFESGGRMAAELVLAAGHRRIGIVAGPKAVLSARQRAEGARKALQATRSLVWEVEAAFSADLDDQVADHLARRDVTALVAASDLVAMGLMKELRRLGLRVPQDVSVVGFDNIPWSEWCNPPLTTIDIPVSEMGAEAVHLLLRRLAAPDEPRRRVVFEVSTVRRESVQAASA
jgi:LacI family transcriptional regulator